MPYRTARAHERVRGETGRTITEARGRRHGGALGVDRDHGALSSDELTRVMTQALSSAVAKQAQEARGVEPLVLVAK
jgi:hypothetical protein